MEKPNPVAWETERGETLIDEVRNRIHFVPFCACVSSACDDNRGTAGLLDRNQELSAASIVVRVPGPVGVYFIDAIGRSGKLHGELTTLAGGLGSAG